MAEKVSVQLYSWEESSSCNQPTLISEELSLVYRWDSVQEVAHLLMSDSDNLHSSTHVDIQRKFCLEERIQSGQNVTTEHHETSKPDEEHSGLGQRRDQVEKDSGSHNLEENPGCWKPDEGCSDEPCSELDVKITQAVSNMYSLLEWSNQKTQESQGKSITLLHSIRLFLLNRDLN